MPMSKLLSGQGLFGKKTKRPVSAPPRLVYANSTADVQAEVMRCSDEGERLRPVGGHRTNGAGETALTVTDENRLSMSHLRGADFVQPEKRRVWVRAGTPLTDLAAWLMRHELTFNATPLYAGQTIGAAVALGSPSILATSIISVRMVHADGRVAVYSSEQDPSLLEAMRITLGALGVLTHVELRCEALGPDVVTRRMVTFDELAGLLDRRPQDSGLISATWFACAPAVVETRETVASLLQKNDALAAAAPSIFDQAQAAVMESVGQNLLVRYASAIPGGKRWSDRLSSRYLASPVRGVLPQQLMLPTRMISYALPFEAAGEALTRIRDLWSALRFHNYAPLRIEFAPADRGWLSPTQGCDSALFSFPYSDSTPTSFIEALCLLLERHDARPAWVGLPPDYMPTSTHYPRLDEFCELRAKFDPHGVFLNPFLAQLFEVPDR
jgi:FAD/FMN-containing dehydrogenase